MGEKMLVDLIYNIEKKIERKGIHKITVLYWYMARILLNVIAVRQYKRKVVIKNNKREEYTDKKVIVSLTSFPARISNIWMVLETLYNQSVSADEIQLWLADEQFQDKKEIELLLSKYVDSGLQILYCDDIRSHKKYYYAMKENPSSIIVTVDDDIIYPSFMLESLLAAHRTNQDCVICNRAHLMKTSNGRLRPYSEWEKRSKKSRVNKGLLLCPTGCGGVLYPPNLLPDEVFEKRIFTEKCLYADDLWLKCMEYMKGIEVVLTSVDFPEVIDIIGDSKYGLAKTNVRENKNDLQMNELTDYYQIYWQ